MRTTILTILAGGFRPDHLFRSGSQGCWYDWSIGGYSCLYQDAGVTLVSALGQSVGIVLDSRFGLTRGPELAEDRSFDNPAYWTTGAGWSVADGVATASATGAGIYKPNLLTVGKWYEATITITRSAGSIYLPWDSTGAFDALVSASGTHARVFRAASSTTFYAGYGSGFTGTIDNVSVREILGNHAVQATADNRPTLTASKIDYDGVNDELVTTWASALGTNCTVGRAVAGVGASILTGQTIGTTYTDNTDHRGLVIIDRALSPQETLGLTRYLNRKAGL
jgi:hypothetical protein